MSVFIKYTIVSLISFEWHRYFHLLFIPQELADHVLQLQSSNTQLKNLLRKQMDGDSSATNSKVHKRPFDFSKYVKPHSISILFPIKNCRCN